jgi:hypothetical protein
LVVLVTLVCFYAACWRVTRLSGTEDIESFAVAVAMQSPAPFIVTARYSLLTGRLIVDPDGKRVGMTGTSPHEVDLYYFWFFGYVAKLPYEREIKPRGQVEFSRGLTANPARGSAALPSMRANAD